MFFCYRGQDEKTGIAGSRGTAGRYNRYSTHICGYASRFAYSNVFAPVLLNNSVYNGAPSDKRPRRCIEKILM